VNGGEAVGEKQWVKNNGGGEAAAVISKLIFYFSASLAKL